MAVYGGRKSKRKLKKGVEHDLKSKGNFEADFLRILIDFGTTLGAKIDPESEKKGIKNKTEFQSKL